MGETAHSSSLDRAFATPIQNISAFRRQRHAVEDILLLWNELRSQTYKRRYDNELPYQRPDLIELMEIEINNVHTSFYKSVRECLDC